MIRSDMDYLLKRLGQAFLAAGNVLLDSEQAPPAVSAPANPTGNEGATPDQTESNEGATPAENGATQQESPEVVDEQPRALGEVAVIANRAPLRSEPTKRINVDLGRMLEGERAPLDAISEDKKWYRVDVRNFAGLHTIPDDATYAWGEAKNFEIITLN